MWIQVVSSVIDQSLPRRITFDNERDSLRLAEETIYFNRYVRSGNVK